MKINFGKVFEFIKNIFCTHADESRENIAAIQDGSGVAEFTCNACGRVRSEMVANARTYL